MISLSKHKSCVSLKTKEKILTPTKWRYKSSANVVFGIIFSVQNSIDAINMLKDAKILIFVSSQLLTQTYCWLMIFASPSILIKNK